MPCQVNASVERCLSALTLTELNDSKALYSVTEPYVPLPLTGLRNNLTFAFQRNKGYPLTSLSSYLCVAPIMTHGEPLLPNAVGTIVDDGINITWRTQDEPAASCFACWENSSETLSHIPYHNILWCSVVPNSDDAFEISYLHLIKNEHKVSKIIVQLTGVGYQDAETYTKQILDNSYPGSFKQPNILLLINVRGGKGDAGKLYRHQIKPILQASHIKFTYMETKHSKHALEIARDLDIDQYDIVACCSGDGIPHEFINGLYKRPDCVKAFNKLAVTQLPCGLGNAFSLSTYGTTDTALATLEMLKLTKMKMDIMLLSQGKNVSLSFLSQAYGAIADSDIGTEHLRWMGSVRFELGLAYKIFTKAKYPCDLYVKYAIENKKEIQEHFKLYSKYQESLGNKNDREVLMKQLQAKYPGLDSPVASDWVKIPSEETDNLSIFYVGNMPYVLTDAQFFPAAISDDGYMDLLVFHNKIPLYNYTRLLLNVSTGRHVHNEDVRHAKITAYRLVPRVNPKHHYVSIDGENFPVEPMQVEVLPCILTVLLKDKSFVDTRFGEH